MSGWCRSRCEFPKFSARPKLRKCSVKFGAMAVQRLTPRRRLRLLTITVLYDATEDTQCLASAFRARSALFPRPLGGSRAGRRAAVTVACVGRTVGSGLTVLLTYSPHVFVSGKSPPPASHLAAHHSACCPSCPISNELVRPRPNDSESTVRTSKIDGPSARPEDED